MKSYAKAHILAAGLLLLLAPATAALASSQPYISKHGINFGTGNKYHQATDISLAGLDRSFAFTRTYNSQSTKEGGILGYGWTSSFGEYLQVETETITLVMSTGRHITFKDDGQGNFINETGKKQVITATADGHKLTQANGAVHSYDSQGKIVRIDYRNNTYKTFSYAGDLLVAVGDTFGRSLTLEYQDGRLLKLSSAAGEFTYSYDANSNLTSVVKPDNTQVEYLYADPSDPHNLTGIIDEAGARALTLTYDNQDRVTSSAFAQDHDQVTISYDSSLERTVTDSKGVPSTFQLEVKHGIVRVASYTGPGCSSCGSSSDTSYIYNDRLQIISSTDGLGRVSKYEYDPNGNKTKVTKAAGTTQEQVTTYTFTPDFNQTASIIRDSVSNPGQQSITSMGYDSIGNLQSRVEVGFSGNDPISRTIGYSYDPYGRITAIDGPRSDVNDITTLSYYANEEVEGTNRGFLQSVTNSLGHTTSYGQYNVFGSAGTIISPNATTNMTYDALGRLLTRTVNGITTSYSYDPTGRIAQITLPDSRFISYTYHANGQPLTISDNQGNSIAYQYDSVGKKIREEIYDPNNELKQYATFEYDDSGHLSKTILPDGSETELSYDVVGNLVNKINGLGNSNNYSYDALNQLITTSEPDDTHTGYSYDDHGNLISVTDAEGHTTTFTYDDLGRKLTQTSADTGTTSYSYDPAGNLIAKTDNSGVTISYQYDALGRLLSIHHPDSSQDVSYLYDQWENGIGRLSVMNDSTGATSYLYDEQGRLVVEERKIGETSYAIDYAYNANSELTTLLYPSGRQIDYQRDASGRIVGVLSTYEDEALPLATGGSYLPFGPLNNLVLGNNLTLANSFDQQYRPLSMTAGSLYDRSYQYQATGQITGIMDNISSEASQSFAYDELGRLTSAMGKYGTMGYSYDKVGNRTGRSWDGVPESYYYLPGTNQLAQVSGEEDTNYSYDLAGNITGKGEDSYNYDQNNRITTAIHEDQVVGEYGYDGRNLRTVRKVEGKIISALYDASGNLLAEMDARGRVIREYVYMDGQRLSLFEYRQPLTLREQRRVAWENRPGMMYSNRHGKKPVPPGIDRTLKGREIAKHGRGHGREQVRSHVRTEAVERIKALSRPKTYWYVNDHLGTPQCLVDSEGAVAWRGDYLPFGGVAGSVAAVGSLARFPGQYYDSETGLYYNWHRFYDPATGRYISADPIGLAGGINLYAYVGANPINAVDPMGLWKGIVPGRAGSRHHNRNEHQKDKCPPTKPCEEEGWMSEGKSPTHGGHESLRGTGSNLGYQCVYDDKGNLVTDPEFEGTYDYWPPYQEDGNLLIDVPMHFLNDVFPWILGGN